MSPPEGGRARWHHALATDYHRSPEDWGFVWWDTEGGGEEEVPLAGDEGQDEAMLCRAAERGYELVAAFAPDGVWRAPHLCFRKRIDGAS